jgi:peptidoglycan/xylan/chitin deacetylase (PgdA/CDA1 family)
MGWPELRDAVARGVDVGAHSHTHPKLDELPLRLARDEIRRSLDVLAEGLGRRVRTFAYPHGYHGPRVRQLVVDAGLAGAVAVKHAMSSTDDDRFALARIIVHGDTSTAVLARLLRGEGLQHPPYPTAWRSTAWRFARRGRRSLAGAMAGRARQ